MPESFELRPLSGPSIPDAIEKAERYRLLGEPDETESVCLDILDAEPGHQAALVILILAMTDQFRREQVPRVQLAQEYVGQLTDEYQRSYYAGVILEREARAYLKRGTPRVFAFKRFCEAMDRYEEAARIRPEGDDSAILRWNACVRAIRRQQLRPWLEKKESSRAE